MINKDGKLFGKISVIDIIVVLFVAVAALGIYSRFFVGNEKVETASSHIEYKMKVAEVRKGTVDALFEYKGPVYDFTTKEYMGEITEVTYTDMFKGVETVNGQMVKSEVPDRYNVTVTVRVDGKINSTGYYTANNQVVAAGSNMIFLSKAAKTTGTILDVYEVE